MNTLQQQTLARGIAAQVERDKAMKITYLAIRHPKNVEAHNIRAKLVQYLPPPCTMKVDPAAEDLLAKLVETEALVNEQAQQIEELRARLQLAQVGKADVTDKQAWVGIREAAEILNKSYSTIWRAIRDGRIECRETKVKKHSGWEVIVDTFRAKQSTTKH